MKFVYLQSIYFLTVLILGLNITRTKLWNLWICTSPPCYLYTIWSRNTTHARWWNTCL